LASSAFSVYREAACRGAGARNWNPQAAWPKRLQAMESLLPDVPSNVLSGLPAVIRPQTPPRAA